jgi:hypothetical protein
LPLKLVHVGVAAPPLFEIDRLPSALVAAILCVAVALLVGSSAK